jgi:hypothetical protein
MQAAIDHPDSTPHFTFGRPMGNLVSVDATVRPSNLPSEVFASQHQQSCFDRRKGATRNDKAVHIKAVGKTTLKNLKRTLSDRLLTISRTITVVLYQVIVSKFR